MRHRILRGLLAAVFAVSLVACSNSGDGPDGKKTTAVKSTPDANSPKLTYAGGKPLIKFPKADPPKELKVTVLEKGKGAEIEASDVIVADYVGQVWGKTQPFDSSFAKGTPLRMPLSKLVPGWGKGLAGLHVGDKVMLSIPPKDGYGPSGQPDAGISGDDTIVFYVEVHDALSITEAGQADATAVVDQATLPVRITGAIGKPVTKVEVKENAAEPTTRTKTVIARGTGPEVGSKGTMYVSYYVASKDGTVKETTWDGKRGPQASTMGWGTPFDELVGTPVGSRVLLTVPKTQENSGSASSVPPVFVVVDILAYYQDG